MRILIGVTAGIAAYKALETARLAVKAGHSVRVIQTPTSERFVGKASFAGITGAPVLTDEFETDPARGSYPGEPFPERAAISHLALVERADVYLIAPASANTIAKLATGLADNLVTTAAIAAGCPVAVAPAMNNRMYLHPATQENIELLQQRGVTIIEPGTGQLASHGEAGIGRLAEPADLLAACEALVASGGPAAAAAEVDDAAFAAGAHAAAVTSAADARAANATGAKAPMAGVKVLVTAGGTQEPIDSVRFIGNHSSGRMGYAIAQVAYELGAEVTVIAANVRLDPPQGARVIPVQTAAQLKEACESEFPSTEVLLMAAAVADFRPTNPADHKLKKTGADALSSIQLEPTEDIVSGLAAHRAGTQTVVGFAAEHGEGAIAYGLDKLKRKGIDAIVVNDISRPEIGFDATDNEVVIITRDGNQVQVPKAPKEEVAEVILAEVTRLRGGQFTPQLTVVD